MEKKYCLNLEDMSKNMFDCLKSFYKAVEREGGEKVKIDECKPFSKYRCNITGKICVANSVKSSIDSGQVSVEYNEGTARKCIYYDESKEQD